MDFKGSFDGMTEFSLITKLVFVPIVFLQLFLSFFSDLTLEKKKRDKNVCFSRYVKNEPQRAWSDQSIAI